MSLTPREKWIHMYTMISILGEARGEPESVINSTIAAMRYERCRKLTDQDIYEIIGEIEEDTLACCGAMDYIMSETEAHACGGGNC